MPDSTTLKRFPLRPTIPVVAMFLGLCGATAVFAGILWLFLDHRAQDRFAVESKNVAIALEKQVADAMSDLRRLQTAAQGSSRGEVLPDVQEVELVWRGSTAPPPSAILLGVRSNSIANAGTTPIPDVGDVAALAELISNTTFPVTRRICLPAWPTNLPNCECLEKGSDLLRSYGSGQVLSPVVQRTIGSGAIEILGAMSSHPLEGTNSVGEPQPERFFLIAMAAIYSSGSGSMHGNAYSRFPNTGGLISAVYSVESLLRGPLNAWSRDFHIKLQYGVAEHDEFRDRGPPIVLGTPGNPTPRVHAIHEVDLGAISGRLYLEPTSHWLRSTGTWTAWVVLGVGTAGALWLAVWMTRQIEVSRDREFETMELRAANTALAVVREAREQITRELHDNTLQNLYALGLELKRGRERLQASPDEVRDCLDRGLEEVRHISQDLRQFLTQGGGEQAVLGAVEVFGSIVERFRRGSGADIQLRLDPKAVRQLSAHATAELAQILREAISNALRHGSASRIDIDLSPQGPDGWEFTIRDNGSGFDASKPRSGNGFGLGHMETRTTRLGAAFSLDTRPGEGCRITVTQPGSPVPPSSEIPA